MNTFVFLLMNSFRMALRFLAVFLLPVCSTIAERERTDKETSSLPDDSNRSADADLTKPSDSTKKVAYVIPIRDQIGAPILDILRRGMKTALKENKSPPAEADGSWA